MNALANSNETTPSIALKVLVEQHGLWAVLAALAALIMRPKRVIVGLDDLSPHMRRDIGLPPPQLARNYWELR